MFATTPTRRHTSTLQFELMVSFMERHGDLCKPKDGARGKIRTVGLWEELTKQLNCNGSGDSKTEEKWKKVWSDLKNNVKKKAAKINKEARQTGGGPAYEGKLGDLEVRVLAIIGVTAAVGMDVDEVAPVEVEEIGFPEALATPSVNPDLPKTSQPSALPNVFVSTERELQPAAAAVQVSPESQPPSPATPKPYAPPKVALSPPGQRRKRRGKVSTNTSATELFIRSDAATRAHQRETAERDRYRMRLEERRLNLEERRLELEEGWQRLAEKFLTNQAAQTESLQVLIKKIDELKK